VHGRREPNGPWDGTPGNPRSPGNPRTHCRETLGMGREPKGQGEGHPWEPKGLEEGEVGMKKNAFIRFVTKCHHMEVS